MTWYSIAVKYTTVDNETKVYSKKNMTGKELMKFREMVYDVGLFVEDHDCPGTEGTIISPYCIGNIDVYMQDTKFE